MDELRNIIGLSSFRKGTVRYGLVCPKHQLINCTVCLPPLYCEPRRQTSLLFFKKKDLNKND